MIDDHPKRMMVKSTERKIKIFQAIAEKEHLDTHTIINLMMLEWVLSDLDDPELIEPIKEIFSA